MSTYEELLAAWPDRTSLAGVPVEDQPRMIVSNTVYDESNRSRIVGEVDVTDRIASCPDLVAVLSERAPIDGSAGISGALGEDWELDDSVLEHIAFRYSFEQRLESTDIDALRAWTEYVAECRERGVIPFSDVVGQAERLAAEDALIVAEQQAAVNEQVHGLAAFAARGAGPVQYEASSSSRDPHYDIAHVAGHRFRDDERFAASSAADDRWGELHRLATSPDWRDRIRAKALLSETRVSMPDGFPAIHEVDQRSGRVHVWVASADEEMLQELLPLYQELWDAYHSQWPNREPRRLVLDRIDGVSPSDVVRPGTTAEEVIGYTMLVHTGIYPHAPRRLQLMHPDRERFGLALNED